MKTKLLLALLFVLSTSINAQIINDNFDSETIGSLPTGWVIKYNGTGTANQQVVNTTSVSPDNSFELVSASSPLAQLYKSFLTVPNKISIELNMKSESSLAAQTGYFSLYNTGENNHLSIVEFNNGNIITYYHDGSAGNKYVIQAFEVDTWYHIKIEADLITRVYQVYIDELLVSGTFNSNTINEFPLSPADMPNSVLIASGNGGVNKMWFDDVKLYETPELVAHYPFNGNANDISGLENNGTVYGATLTADKDGIANSAYYFDGVNDYIQCLFSGPLEATSRTISFWAKTDVVPTNGYNSYGNVVLSYGISPSSNDYGARFDVVLNSKAYGLGCGLGGGELTKSFDNSDLNWHFYTVVFNNSIGSNLTDILFYADGNLLTTNGAYNNVNPVIHTKGEYPIHIGMLYDYGRYFKGSIDEIRIYNKALTETEILNLFNNNTLKAEKIENIALSDFYINNNTLYFKNTKNLTEITKVEVYNLLGQKVFKTLEAEKEISFKQLKQGIHILKVKNTNGNYSTSKFIIN